jgi:hypothetical protein
LCIPGDGRIVSTKAIICNPRTKGAQHVKSAAFIPLPRLGRDDRRIEYQCRQIVVKFYIQFQLILVDDEISRYYRYNLLLHIFENVIGDFQAVVYESELKPLLGGLFTAVFIEKFLNQTV